MKLRIRIFKWICTAVTITAVLSGCSLALDSQQDIAIPIRKDGFEINVPTVDRFKDVVGEYRPEL